MKILDNQLVSPIMSAFALCAGVTRKQHLNEIRVRNDENTQIN
jgi:hypothetical protein